MLILKLFQHIRVGGVTGFGLLHRGQAQLLKEQLPKLFGGIDIKGAAGVAVNQRFTVRDPLSKHLAKLFQLLSVNGNAPLLHPEQHIAQWKLNIPVEMRHPSLFQFCFQHRREEPQGFGTGGSVPVLHRNAQKICRKLGNRVIRLGRIQVIGSKGRIKEDASPAQAKLRHPVHGCLGIVEHQSGIRRERLPHHGKLHGGQSAHAPLPGNAHTSIRSKEYGIRTGCFADTFFLCKGLCFGFRGNGCLPVRASEAVLVDKPDKFQLLKQGIQLRSVIILPQSILRGKIDGRFRNDRCQIIG